MHSTKCANRGWPPQQGLRPPTCGPLQIDCFCAMFCMRINTTRATANQPYYLHVDMSKNRAARDLDGVRCLWLFVYSCATTKRICAA